MLKLSLSLGLLCVALCHGKGTLKLAGVEVKGLDTGRQSQLKRAFDKYEKLKLNEDKDTWVDTHFTAKSSTVAIGEVNAYIANSQDFKAFTKTLNIEEIRQFADQLQDATIEERGSRLYSTLTLHNPRTREIAVMLVVHEQRDKTHIDFNLVRLKEVATTRLGVEWMQSWHDQPENQRMLEDWITYRLLLRAQEQSLLKYEL